MRYILSIIGLALVVGAGYFALAQYVDVAHGQTGLMVADNTVGGAGANGAQVIALLNRLNNVKLNGAIFSDPNFTSLQDRSVSVDPQTIGRSNPFLSVYGNASTTVSKAKSPLLKKK